jgi:hypothetical protein
VELVTITGHPQALVTIATITNQWLTTNNHPVMIYLCSPETAAIPKSYTDDFRTSVQAQLAAYMTGKARN